MNSRQQVLGADSPKEDFVEKLNRVFQRLARLDAIGVKCPLRQSGECHCSSCPISQISDPEGERHQLCHAGVEEERIVMLSRVANLGLAPSGV